MMSVYAQIRVDTQANGQCVYEWIGEPSGLVQISTELLQYDPDLLEKLPWTLTYVSTNIFEHYRLYRRADQVGPSEHKGDNHA